MIDQHIQTMTEIAEGREAAAYAEGLVMDGLQEFVDRFNIGDRDPKVMRFLRIYNDARHNRTWALKEAAAARAYLEFTQ